MQKINKVQKLQFELMKLSSFNEFDGKKVTNDLTENRELWVSCVWGRLRHFELIPLRDIVDGLWNTDTLYILTHKEKVKEIKNLARNWKVDEFGVTYSDREEGTIAFDHKRVWRVFGRNLKDDECIIRIWWD